MHIYAFGSICRGEVDQGSDIDLLACIENDNLSISKEKFSIYKYPRITELWQEGNPFSWHLHLESKIIFSSDNNDFIKSLGTPSPYMKTAEDCAKFRELFEQSYEALVNTKTSKIFNLSCMFLATRNFATCYSLGNGKPIFSRKSPLLIDEKLEINDRVFNTLERARILSTRGYGSMVNESEINEVIQYAPKIYKWLNRLSKVD
ncbi:MAG: nucleotidyltransferase [Methylobacter sp.]|nr:MAG: nucleotidyltransferase [Methylobacter sp.]